MSSRPLEDIENPPAENSSGEDDDVPDFLHWLETLYSMTEESPNE